MHKFDEELNKTLRKVIKDRAFLIAYCNARLANSRHQSVYNRQAEVVVSCSCAIDDTGVLREITLHQSTALSACIDHLHGNQTALAHVARKAKPIDEMLEGTYEELTVEGSKHV